MLPATEAADPRTEALDTWPVASQLLALWEGQMAAVAAVGPALPRIADAIEAAVAALRDHPAGRLVYVGAGSSGRLGAQDGAELNPTFDWPDERLLLLPAGGIDALLRAIENAEDDRDAAAALVARHGIGPGDVVIGVAASGTTPFTRSAIAASRDAGALTIGLANSPGAPLLDDSAHAILVETAPEPIAGSTRMKAGTAQKIVLNLLSTAIMTGLGRVYRGRMVDMRARNEKLRARAVRMVEDLAGVDQAAASRALEAASYRLKPAILVAGGRSPAQAAAALARSGGDLRRALAEPIPAP